jgi:hypothetical protein
MTVSFLALEAVSNFFQAFDHPIALLALGKSPIHHRPAQGLERVYILFLIAAFYHAIAFLCINGYGDEFLLAGSAFSVRRCYFTR